MESDSTQLLFFQHIKSLLPGHLSFVDEVAGLLNISNDSAYRRIRGEKPIAIEELQQLANHFKISIDQFLHLKSNSYIFSGELTVPGANVFENWMENIYKQLSLINSVEQKHLYFLAKDMPLMTQFSLPDLLGFKSFLWRRSILHDERIQSEKFSLKRVVPEHLEIGKRIITLYNKIPTTEIWNLESINSTIRQIQVYRDMDMFETKEDLDAVQQAVLKIVNHMERQAELGIKFDINAEPGNADAAYNLFWNELVLGDNTVLFDMSGQRITILNHSVINFMGTGDERFNAYIFTMMQNLIKRSTQLSRVGEKERYRFFNRVREKLKGAARL